MGDVGPLLLSLDQDGWTRPGTALTARSITTILHSRRIATGRREDPTFERTAVLATLFDGATPDEVYAAAGYLDDHVAQALLRTQQLLAEMEPQFSLSNTADRTRE